VYDAAPQDYIKDIGLFYQRFIIWLDVKCAPPASLFFILFLIYIYFFELKEPSHQGVTNAIVKRCRRHRRRLPFGYTFLKGIKKIELLFALLVICTFV